MNFIKDYDFKFNYHPRKANKVTHALSRKELHQSELLMLDYELLEKVRDFNLNFSWTLDGVQLSQLNILCDVKDQFYQAQLTDRDIRAKLDKLRSTQATDGVILFEGMTCIQDNLDLKRMIFEKAHKSNFTIHPSLTKMYHDLKNLFLWQGIKVEIREFVNRCSVCPHVKIEH